MATSSLSTRQSSASDYSGIDFLGLATEGLGSQASSSRVSLNDDEDYTPSTTKPFKRVQGRSNGSHDSLRHLAISAQMTELSYSLGDLETRIFKIQELRHRSFDTNAERRSTDSTESSSSIIDSALGQLDARLETVSQSIATVATAMDPLLSAVKTPTLSKAPENDEDLLLRKYGDLMNDWENLRTEAEVLRAELKEDKWLTIFRTVSEQADGMMESLEKIVRQCQDFIYQVHQSGRPSEDARPTSLFSDRRPISLGAFDDLLKSFEAKKKYYVPSTNKVISILDKGVRDRVTKNGECLRKHADLRARWRTLRDRIGRIDVEMEKARKILVWIEHEGSEVESASEASLSLGPPKPGRSTRAPSSTSTSTSALARSISPFRKFAQRMTNTVKTPVGRSTPTQSSQSKSAEKSLSAQTQTISRRTSFFPFRSPQPGQDTFQGRPKLYSSTSSALSAPLTATSSAFGDESAQESTNETPSRPPKPRWNISTKPDNSEPPPLPPVPHHSRHPSGTIRTTPPRPPSSARHRAQTPSRPPTIQPPQSGNRRAMRNQSRPTTPSNRIIQNSQGSPPTPPRPGSRAHSSLGGIMATPRARPKTPSLIPTPNPTYLGIFGSSASSQGSDDGVYPPSSILQRAFTPSPSISPHQVANGNSTLHARRASSSKLPIPVFHVSSSRAPSPAMSNYYSVSPSSSVAPSADSSAIRSQTPDSSPRPKSRTHQVSASIATSRPSLRPSSSKGPPSSFKDSPSWTPPSKTPPSSHARTPSRAQSRVGAATPGADTGVGHLYIPAGPHDPLDNEIAKIVNSISHGLLFERVDPPLKYPPRPGEELMAQYSVSNALSKKTLPCRLRIASRGGVETRKVMCRVGGGWMDLSVYLVNKQNGAL